jgi:hypothetical protein
MNDLDQFGPSASEPTEGALAAARARLDAAIASPSPAVRRTRRLPLLVAASVVAAAAVGVAVTPALVGSDHSIALAAVDPLTFPVTPTWLPEGLGDPVFTYEAGVLEHVRYGKGDDFIDISPAASLNGGCRDDEAVRVDVNGQPGWGFDGCADEPPGPATNEPQWFVVWEQPDGDVLQVSGNGKLAEPGTVERIAESVVDQRQPIDLFLTIAPSGWRLLGYQSNHHVTWSDPDSEQGGDDSDLTVNLIPRVDADLDDYGARDVHTVGMEGRQAIIGRTVDEHDKTVTWVLQTTSPDGTAFSVIAPGRLTEEQVIAIAAGVRHR